MSKEKIPLIECLVKAISFHPGAAQLKPLLPPAGKTERDYRVMPIQIGPDGKPVIYTKKASVEK